MATASNPVQQPAKAPKHEAFVEDQLQKVRSRIRLLDIGAALLVLCIGTFVYGVTLMLLDRWLELPALARQAAFGLYLLAALAFIGWRIVWPLTQRINPYYAAVQVEHAVPGAKNSVVNWLDLKDEKLPWTIRAAVGQKAAKDLSQAPLEEAISGRHVLYLVGGTALLVCVLLGLLIAFGPRQFVSLAQRAFLPFEGIGIANKTTLTILEPTPADTTVPINQSVQFRVKVSGREPDARGQDAVQLLFRYSQSDPNWIERRFERGVDEWSYRLPGFELASGFWYKVKGGDFETAEHRVGVRSSPLVTGFEVKYTYRPYLKRPDFATQDPNLEGLVGTAVSLTVRTNRPVKQGWIIIDGDKKLIDSVPVPESREAMRFNLVLEQEGTYRVRYVADDGEPSGDSLPYTIKVIHDHAPEVKLTGPGDLTLPLNGVLQPVGSAFDDFGITGMTLRMRIKDGAGLEPRRYRQNEKKSFQLIDGTYPRDLNYSDIVELEKLKTEAGQPAVLKPNMQIEYWLEAADNCDYPPPGPNVGKSVPPMVITLAAASDPKQQKENLANAQKNQQGHNQKQDDEQKQANDKIKRQPNEPEAIPPMPEKDPVAQKVEDQLNQPTPPQDATADDVNKAANDLKSNDPNKRQQAENRLNDIEQQNKDPMVRDQARQALEDAGLKERKPENATREDVNKAAGDLQNPQRNKQAQQRLNDIKDKAKDPDVREAAKEALKNQPNTPENANQQDVERAAEKARSNDPKQRQDGRQDLRNIKDQAKDPGVRKSAEQQLQKSLQGAKPEDVKQDVEDLKSGDPSKQDRSEQDLRDLKQQAKDPAVKQAAENALKQAGKNPNLDPRNANKQDVDNAVKQAGSNDPKQRQQGRQDLNDIKDQAKDPGTKQAAENALDQANQNANKQDVQNAAQQAQSDNPQQRQQGREDLRDMANQAKDPGTQKAAQDAQKQANQNANKQDVQQAAQQAQSGDPQDRQEGRQDLRDMAQNAKDEGTKQAAQEALRQAQQNAGKEDVQQASQEAKSSSPQERQQARQDLNEMSKQAGSPDTKQAAQDASKQASQNANKEDVNQANQKAQSGSPQERSQGRQDLNQMAQNAKDEGAKQAAQQAGQQAAEKAGKEDVQQAAQQAQSGNGQERQQGRQDLNQMAQNAKDPGTQKSAQQALQQANQNAGKEDVNQAAQQANSNDPGQKQQGKDDLRQMAQNAKDQGAKQAAQQALKQSAEKGTKEDLNQANQQAQSGDPTQKEQGKQDLRDLAKNAKDPQVKQGAEKSLQQSAEKSGKEDVNQAAKQAGAGDPAQKQRAKEDLKDIAQNAKDPAVRKQAEDALKEFAKNATAEDIARAAKELQERMKAGDPSRKPDPKELKDIADLAKDPDVQKMAGEIMKEMAKQANNQKAGKPELDQAGKDLKSGDPKQEQAGAERLQDIAKQAQDPNIRKQAEEMLKQAGKPSERPGQNATPQDVQKAERDLKSTDKEKFEQALKDLARMAKNAQDLESKAAAGKSLGDIGLKEGDRQQLLERAAAAATEPDTAKALKANLEHKKFAGDLQLQRFKEAVTPDMLKKADISAEDWERFLQNYRDYLKRLDGDLKDLEKLDPKDKVTLLPQGGVRRLDAVRGTPENLQNAGQFQPPPQYRNAYQDFTRELSKMKQKLEK